MFVQSDVSGWVMKKKVHKQITKYATLQRGLYIKLPEKLSCSINGLTYIQNNVDVYYQYQWCHMKELIQFVKDQTESYNLKKNFQEANNNRVKSNIRVKLKINIMCMYFLGYGENCISCAYTRQKYPDQFLVCVSKK